MKIAVVMSYYNRQAQLDRTAETIRRSRVYPTVIIVDDASKPPLCIPARISDRTVLMRTVPEEKFWTTCPVIPYNRALQEALNLGADVIVLQSPECLHVGDVLGHVRAHARKGRYLTFACFSAAKDQWPIHDDWRTESSMYKNETHSNGPPGWFNHPRHRPAHLEFCAALHRDDVLALNGYDERFADGVACGDCDLLRRIKNLGLELAITDPDRGDPFVVHQWHYSGPDPYADGPRFKRNQDLFLRLEREDRGHRAVHWFTKDLHP